VRPRAKVAIDSLWEVACKKSIGAKMKTLTFVLRSYEGYVNNCVTFAIEYLGNR